MASPPPGDGSLRSRLSAVLPRDRRFTIFHLSTPPTRCDALYSAPPSERPDRTYCENHFLAVAVDAPPAALSSGASARAGTSSMGPQVLVFGVEVFIYTTAFSTTLFVSKADSTGYLSLLDLPRGTPSPIREVLVTFIRYLIERRKRKDVQFIVSLFARSQDQYLFPGSVRNKGKHILDDRGLVKWWCRVLNPLLDLPSNGGAVPWKSVNAYLVVPGLDSYETRAFIPRTSRSSSWSLAHPLERISHYHREFDWVPPRCLIPRFPDDPKSRFRDELDEEAAHSSVMSTTGSWKSVKSLDMFWEMMAYRQECSSGRMTGFIWVVFDDEVEETTPTTTATLPTPATSFSHAVPTAPETPKKQRIVPSVTPTTTPRKLFPSKADSAEGSPSKPSTGRKTKQLKKKKLKGKIKPRMAHIKTEQRNYLLNRPVSTAYYHWPPQGRGQRIVSDADYKRNVELLLHLDFANLDKAVGSTRRWASEVGAGSRCGYEVVGTRDPPAVTPNGAVEGSSRVNNLSGLIKRKRAGAPDQQHPEDHAAKVNVLGTGLVNKRPKPEDDTTSSEQPAPAVNVLGAGLIRKKAKS